MEEESVEETKEEAQKIEIGCDQSEDKLACLTKKVLIVQNNLTELLQELEKYGKR